MTRIQSYALGEWFTAGGAGTVLYDAVTGEHIADASSEGLDFAAMASYARETGGRALRRLTFHQRARLLKALALYLTQRFENWFGSHAPVSSRICSAASIAASIRRSGSVSTSSAPYASRVRLRSSLAESGRQRMSR